MNNLVWHITDSAGAYQGFICSPAKEEAIAAILWLLGTSEWPEGWTLSTDKPQA